MNRVLFSTILLAPSWVDASVVGHWMWIDDANSSTLPLWSKVDLYISTSNTPEEDSMQVETLWTPPEKGKPFWTNESVPLGEGWLEQPVGATVFTFNAFMGLRFLENATQQLSGSMSGGNDMSNFTVLSRYEVHASTGLAPVQQKRVFESAEDGSKLTLSVSRDTRTGPALNFTFVPAGSVFPAPLVQDAAPVAGGPSRPPPKFTSALAQERAAAQDYGAQADDPPGPFALALDDDWDLHGDLPTKALLLSLQGLANSVGGDGSGGDGGGDDDDAAASASGAADTAADPAPLLYFLYPDDWDFTYTASFYDYLSSGRPDVGLDVPFTLLPDGDAAAALGAVGPLVWTGDVGYVLWDPDVRDSLPVAYTVSGTRRLLVLTADLVPAAAAALAGAGLALAPAPAVDLRGTLDGMTSAQVSAWAWDEFGAETSTDWMVRLPADE